jgi:glutaredoxin 3
MILLYSKPVCPQCDQAKALLSNKGIAHTVIDIETNAAARDVLVSKGLRSVPQAFHGEELIGGVDKLRTWIQLKEQSL